MTIAANRAGRVLLTSVAALARDPVETITLGEAHDLGALAAIEINHMVPERDENGDVKAAFKIGRTDGDASEETRCCGLHLTGLPERSFEMKGVPGPAGDRSKTRIDQAP